MHQAIKLFKIEKQVCASVEFEFEGHILKFCGWGCGERPINLQLGWMWVQYLSNEKMTFASFLKTNNMKHLLRALSGTYRVAPAPLYLFRLAAASPAAPPASTHFILPNRCLSSAALHAHPNHFSVWSPHHLQRLQSAGLDGLEKRVLITNPFKSEQFIAQALSGSITSMVVSSLDELIKIENVKNKRFRHLRKQMEYYWAYSDEPAEMETLKQARGAIRHVIFDWSEVRSAHRVDELTQKIMETGCALTSVVCSGAKEDSEEMRKWSLQRSSKLAKQVEIRDASDTEGYLLAARSSGSGPRGISHAAQELLDMGRCGQDSVMVQVGKEEWLLSKIARFPLDDQAYLYEIDAKPESKELQLEQPSLI